MKDRNEQGRFTQKQTDSEILMAVKTNEPAGTSEIAEALDISRQAADYRLRELRKQGTVASKKIGASLVWFLPSDTGAREPTDSMRKAESTSQQEGTKSKSKPLPESDSTERQENGPYGHLSFPGSKDRQECIAAINAVVEYLKESGPASMREIVTDVMPEYPLRYEIPELEEGERYRGSWWRKVIKPGLEAREDIERPPRGGSKWKYKETS